MKEHKEGGIEAPTRHPLAWRDTAFYDEEMLNKELARVFDVCHGCRRCVNLCESFPTLFDLIDESSSYDVAGVSPQDYPKVSEQCYLCDLCYQTKCPYVPPHKWQIDFPHLMLRAKAVKFKQSGAKLRDRIITSTDEMGRILSLPLVHQLTHFMFKQNWWRSIVQSIIGIHKKAQLPRYLGRTLSTSINSLITKKPKASAQNQRKVAIFTGCYGKWNQSEPTEDLIAVLKHNNIKAQRLPMEWCCAMPKYELGDLKAVERNKERNIKVMLAAVEEGHDIISTVPSCVLMFKQELPLMFPEDKAVAKVAQHIYDPFEYLAKLRRQKQLNTDFKRSLGNIVHQVACHQRVQNIGNKTKELLSLVPETTVQTIERCSGHDGTYAIKEETFDNAMKIVAPIVKNIRATNTDHYTSDCPLSAKHIAHALGEEKQPLHPVSLLLHAYTAPTK